MNVSPVYSQQVEENALKCVRHATATESLRKIHDMVDAGEPNDETRIKDGALSKYRQHFGYAGVEDEAGLARLIDATYDNNKESLKALFKKSATALRAECTRIALTLSL